MFEKMLLPSLQMARRRYLDAIANLEERELPWRFAPESNSIGFLIQHIAEVEYRFCSMFFGQPVPDGVSLATIGPVKDDGQYTNLDSLLSFQEASHAYLLEALHALSEEKWDVPVEAPIGVMTPREALGRLIYHTGYHAGQIGLIRKYAGER